MNKKFLNILVIVFACFFISTNFSVKAQNQFTIISAVNSSTFLGANIFVKGQALPNSTILVSIKDEKDAFAYSVKTSSDANGSWSANLSQSLKSGKYNIEAVENNENGTQIGSAKFGPIEVRGSFVFIVGIFSFLVIILLAGFVGGWYINKIAEIKRYRRILISQRDIIASYSVLKKDVDKALKNLSGGVTEEQNISEVEFLLKRISENLEKMNTYVVKGVNIIGKYDIIKKIENFFDSHKN